MISTSPLACGFVSSTDGPLARVRALEAWLFDLDGVLTDTASVHDAAWKKTFDELLVRRAGGGTEFKPFDPVSDYERYVDGKPRLDGVRSFLASRHRAGRGRTRRWTGLRNPERRGPPEERPVYADASRFRGHSLPRFGGAPEVPSRDRGEAGSRVGQRELCRRARCSGNFPIVRRAVDGNVAAEKGLAGKPAPDTYLYAATLLGVEPRLAAVLEDAPAGVASGRAGRFGLVVGVSRGATREELLQSGADIVVEDLSELLDSVAS